MNLEKNPARLWGPRGTFKRLIDIVLSAFILIVLSPVLMLITMWVKLDSEGPVIYRRGVLGVGGRPFDAFKFRSMFINGGEILMRHPELKRKLETEHKLKDDPRVTRAGRFLRRFSLDELPQLVNVLRGQMSLIGPRMISPPELQQYAGFEDKLLSVRPGMTGLWQVSGRADTSYDERVRLDMFYIDHYSPLMDVRIFLKTPLVMLGAKGAY